MNRFTLWLGLIFLLIITFIGGRYLFLSGNTIEIPTITVPVERQTFNLQVTERGIVRPAKVVPIKSQISSNQAQIVWLHPEGQPVHKGVSVARFDTKPFLDNLLKAEQKLADAQARLNAANKALQLQQEEEAGKREAVQNKLEIARIKANDLKHGTGKLRRKKLIQKQQQAERTFQITVSELKDFDLLLKKGHVSQRERDKVADKHRAATEALELAKAEVVNFDRFEWPRLLREATVIINTAQAELGRVHRTSAIELQRRHDQVVKFKRDVVTAQRKLNKAQTEVKNCEVQAPINGILLYQALPKPEGRRKIQIGDSIWFGQTFMEIPDTSDMMIEIKVREIDVAKLKIEMDTNIELDAFPGQQLVGKVASIASLAQVDKENPHLRHFQTRIQLIKTLPAIHVGMSATVHIIYRRLKSVLAVPVNALEYLEGSPIVWVYHGKDLQRTKIQLGGINTEWAEVIAGVQEGELVRINRR